MKTEQLKNKTYEVVLLPKLKEGEILNISDIKKFEIMVPPYVIGVGVVSAIDTYMDDNKLTDDYTVASYTEVRY